jgi:hypothetical protein
LHTLAGAQNQINCEGNKSATREASLRKTLSSAARAYKEMKKGKAIMTFPYTFKLQCEIEEYRQKLQ